MTKRYANAATLYLPRFELIKPDADAATYMVELQWGAYVVRERIQYKKAPPDPIQLNRMFRRLCARVTTAAIEGDPLTRSEIWDIVEQWVE